jgi:endonuclease YncB( thermonuclease family)
LLIVAASLAVISYAQTISFGAEVTQVIDGDTLIVKDGNGVDHRICLQAVDAPEDGQEFADVAAEKLTERVLHKPVVVEYAAITLDGCFIGKVSLAGQDIGLTMVTDGYAWHFKDYEKQQSLEDRTLYSQAERDARQAKSGLWASSSPLPPWKYRREHPKTDVSAPAAGDSSTGGTVNVKGYYRKDGTYVRPHTRSAPRKKN